MTDPVSSDTLATSPAPAPLGRRAGLTMMWGQVSKTLEALLTLAIAVAAVRALNPNAFGLYSLLTYLAGSASVLVPAVMIEAAGAVLPRFRDARERASLLALVALLRLAVITAAIAALLPGWDVFRSLFGLDAISVRVFLVGAFYWAVQDLVNSITGFYLVELDLRRVAVWRPLGQVVTLVAIIVIAATEDRWSSSVGEVLAAVAAGLLVTLVGLAWGLRRYGRPHLPPRDATRAVLGLTRTTWLIGVLTFTLATHVDVLLIGALSDTPREVAFYVASVGIVVRAQSLLVSGWLSPMIPALSRAQIEGGRAGMARVWELFAELWLFIALPLNVLLLAVGSPLLVGLFGNEYEPAGGLVEWAAAFNIVVALAGGSLGTSALWALDAQRTVTWVKTVTGAMNVALAVPLILNYGALGAVIATGIATIADAALEVAFAARLGGIRYPVGFTLRTAVASVVVAAPALLIGPGGLPGVVVAAALGLVAYAVAAAVVRPFSAHDLEVLERASPSLAASPLRLLARRDG